MLFPEKKERKKNDLINLIAWPCKYFLWMVLLMEISCCWTGWIVKPLWKNDLCQHSVTYISFMNLVLASAVYYTAVSYEVPDMVTFSNNRYLGNICILLYIYIKMQMFPRYLLFENISNFMFDIFPFLKVHTEGREAHCLTHPSVTGTVFCIRQCGCNS